MITIIKEAHTEVLEETYLEYIYREYPDAGFSFPWKNGEVQLNPYSEKNYKWCQEHPEEVECLGVVKRNTTCIVPALAKCECGEAFYLDGSFYGCTQCPGCGRWYALGGYRVNSPEEREEDLEEDEW